MCHVFFIDSSVNGNLGSFHDLAFVNSAAMNIGLHLFLDHFVSSKSVPDSAIREHCAQSPYPLIPQMTDTIMCLGILSAMPSTFPGTLAEIA